MESVLKPISSYNFSVALFVGAILTLFSYGLSGTMGWIDLNNISNVEIYGVFFNYVCVFLTARKNILAWPTGIVAVVLLGWLFWDLNLYSSMALSILYFLPIQFYGWYRWLYGGEKKTSLLVSYMNLKEWFSIVIFGVIGYGIVVVLNSYFGGTSPFLDTAILTCSIIGQQLMAEKKVESWFFWIVVNIVSTYLYTKSGAYLLGIQYLFFLANAVYGWHMWKKEVSS